MANDTQYPNRIVLGEAPYQTVYELQPDQLLLNFEHASDDDDIEALLNQLGLTPIGSRTERHGPDTLWPTMRWVALPQRVLSPASLARDLLSQHQEVRCACPVYFARDEGPESAAAPVPGTLLVRFKDQPKDEDLAMLSKNLGLKHDPSMSKLLAPFHKFTLVDMQDTGHGDAGEAKSSRRRRRDPFIGEPSRGFAALAAVLRLPEVELAEMDWLKFRMLAAAPNDTFWANQWNMARINMADAWDEQTGDPSVSIAVIDIGCDLTHPDLVFTPNTAANPTHFDAEQVNAGDPPPYDASPIPGDPNGAHGSLVAGLAAASMNNNTGIAGVAGGCRIMPLNFFSFPINSTLAAAINWARSHNANVINMSLGGPSSAIVTTALNNAWSAGLVICAASGNYYSSTEPTSAAVEYPARHAKVIAVGASDQNDERKRPASSDGEEWGSHYGVDQDVVAPGQGLWSTDIQGNAGWNSNNGGAMQWQGVNYASSGDATGDYFALMGGTSGACPQVAGLAALLRLKFPTLTNQQVRDIIERTCEKVSPGTYAYAHDPNRPNGTWHEQIGYGRINAQRALRYADIMIADHDLDSGAVPSSTHSSSGWLPRNFWQYQPYVTNTSQPAAMPTEHEPAKANQDNYVHAYVTNLGPADAQNIQVTWHIMDYPHTELIWPADWNPGNHIAATSIPFLAAGDSVAVEQPWPQALVNVASAYAHPCMVVQAISDRDGGGDLGDYVYQYNNIAQHNISFAQTSSAEAPELEFTLPFAVGHQRSVARRAELHFDVGGARGAKVYVDVNPGDDLPYVDRIRRAAGKHPALVGRKDTCRVVAEHDTRLAVAGFGCRAQVLVKAGSAVSLLPHDLQRTIDIDDLDFQSATSVMRAGRLQMLLHGAHARIGFPLGRGEVVPMAVTLELPESAKPRERFSVEVTQVSDGVVTGGVTLEVEAG